MFKTHIPNSIRVLQAADMHKEGLSLFIQNNVHAPSVRVGSKLELGGSLLHVERICGKV